MLPPINVMKIKSGFGAIDRMIVWEAMIPTITARVVQ